MSHLLLKGQMLNDLVVPILFCFISYLHPNSAMSNHDPWNGLATLMTLLETVVDANKDYLVLEKDEGV